MLHCGVSYFSIVKGGLGKTVQILRQHYILQFPMTCLHGYSSELSSIYTPTVSGTEAE